MLSEAEGAPIGRALTPRGAEAAARDRRRPVPAASTSMRGVEVKHVRCRDVDLEKVWDVESATGMGVLYVGHSKNETSKRKLR